MSVLEKFGTDLSDDKLLSLSRYSEQAERYDDMCEFISKFIQNKCAANAEIEDEPRNLLSVAFKNVVGAKRASWRTLNAEDQIDAELLKKYRTRVEKECRDKCEEVLTLLKDHLLPNTKGKNNESEVFFSKMAGDYCRYLAEISIGDSDTAGNDNKDGQRAKEYYEQAMVVAKEHLNETHPTRLGLALNYSVCYYEILKEPEKACSMAKDAFDAAINKLDTLNDESYKDSTLIMQLLRDNLTLWTSDNDDE